MIGYGAHHLLSNADGAAAARVRLLLQRDGRARGGTRRHEIGNCANTVRRARRGRAARNSLREGVCPYRRQRLPTAPSRRLPIPTAKHCFGRDHGL